MQVRHSPFWGAPRTVVPRASSPPPLFFGGTQHPLSGCILLRRLIWRGSWLSSKPRTFRVHFNPIPTRGGGHIVPPPPPRYTSSNISGTPWATDLKLSDNLNELNWKTKIIFQPPPPTLGYHSNVQSWRMFLKSAFRQFSCQSLPELDVFCYSHD